MPVSYWKTHEFPSEAREKIRIANIGRKQTEEEKKKRADSIRGTKWSESSREKITGVNHYRWIKDRSSVKTTDRQHNDPNYKKWKKAVHIRDEGNCRINNEDCSGRIEAHHILPWKDHAELRYNVNNGITLCHYHHPRVRKEEQRLAPVFTEMVLRPSYEMALIK
jgi:hypothetical protein